jgi:hypothetical protein
MRTAFLEDFDLTSILITTSKGYDSGECPNRWIEAGENRESVVHISDSFSKPRPVCPEMFYEVGGHCEPCPDMMTSDAGAVGIKECEPYNRCAYVCVCVCVCRYLCRYVSVYVCT